MIIFIRNLTTFFITDEKIYISLEINTEHTYISINHMKNKFWDRHAYIKIKFFKCLFQIY